LSPHDFNRCREPNPKNGKRDLSTARPPRFHANARGATVRVCRRAVRASPDQFDAVITDERMPGMSGSAFIREVRGIRRSVPTLLVSGYLGGALVSRAYNLGASEVLKKPLMASELATSLARVLHPQ
jgi:DNA-binding NtrC family response regulator